MNRNRSRFSGIWARLIRHKDEEEPKPLTFNQIWLIRALIFDLVLMLLIGIGIVFSWPLFLMKVMIFVAVLMIIPMIGLRFGPEI
jgi:hypothetical protein